jgi:hypothetical protein
MIGVMVEENVCVTCSGRGLIPVPGKEKHFDTCPECENPPPLEVKNTYNGSKFVLEGRRYRPKKK